MTKTNRVTRFYFHYNKPAKKMSVHFKGKCHIVDDVHCTLPCETKHNKKQPYLVMRGWANRVKIINNWAFIS